VRKLYCLSGSYENLFSLFLLNMLLAPKKKHTFALALIKSVF